MAERHAMGQAMDGELAAAHFAADDAAWGAAWGAAWYTARAATQVVVKGRDVACGDVTEAAQSHDLRIVLEHYDAHPGQAIHAWRVKA